MKPAPVLLVSTPIESALEDLEREAQDVARWEGEDCASVRSIRTCVDAVRRAMKAAEEAWHSTRTAAQATGWSEETLAKYARLRQQGETLPHEWRRLECRPGALGGWMFRVSTIPVKARAA